MTQKKRQLSHFLNFYVFLTVELPGTYDQKEVWDYIHIPDEDGDYVVYNENDSAWWEAHESEVMEMLKTLRIGPDA